MDTEKTRAQSSAQSLRLPQDIIEEILSRLPAKSLLRFRCVSKPWSSLIASKRFVNIHLYNYTCKKTDNKWTRIIFHKEHGLNQYSNMGEQSLDITTDDPKIFDDPKNTHLMPGTIVDSCNGLLCIHKFPGCFFLWNPATRISIMLPEIPIRHLRIKKSGFGWDKHSGAYKVFVGMSNRNDTEKIGQVYSSKTDSWKKLEKVGNLSLRHISGRVAWGKSHVIHWVTESGDFETFDLESETFEMLYLDAIRDEMEKLNMKSKKPGKTEQPGKAGVSQERQPGEAGVSRERQRCCKPFVYAESLVSPVDEIKRVSVFTWASLFR